MLSRLGRRGTSHPLLMASATALLATVTLAYLSGGALCAWLLQADLAGPAEDEPDGALPRSQRPSLDAELWWTGILTNLGPSAAVQPPRESAGTLRKTQGDIHLVPPQLR